jgi:hypothetical protein
MREAMFQDEVASRLKKGVACGSMLLIETIEEGLVSNTMSRIDSGSTADLLP